MSTAAQKTASIEVAKELVQDVFLSLYLRRDHLTTHTTLKSYLFTALKNKIFNHYQKELSKQKYESYARDHIDSSTNDSQENFEAKELNLQIQKKILALPPQCRKVFLMSREEHLSHKEIAELLNISPDTVDQHIQKALRILRSNV